MMIFWSNRFGYCRNSSIQKPSNVFIPPYSKWNWIQFNSIQCDIISAQWCLDKGSESHFSAFNWNMGMGGKTNWTTQSEIHKKQTCKISAPYPSPSRVFFIHCRVVGTLFQPVIDNSHSIDHCQYLIDFIRLMIQVILEIFDIDRYGQMEGDAMKRFCRKLSLDLSEDDGISLYFDINSIWIQRIVRFYVRITLCEMYHLFFTFVSVISKLMINQLQYLLNCQ